MKNKGFTLIELLAVIVILAIIAIIAVPIILNIVNDSKEESNKRSVEMYAKALENAVATYQLKENKAPSTYSDIEKYVEYDGDVACETKQIYSDGNFYLDKCKVNKSEKEYTYGKSQQVYKPQYYYWSEESAIDIGGDLPSYATKNPQEIDKLYYLGVDVDSNNKITAAYTCFVKNEIEYCLKGLEEAADTNKTILEDAFKDVKGACNDEPGKKFVCETDDLYAKVEYGYYVSTRDKKYFNNCFVSVSPIYLGCGGE